MKILLKDNHVQRLLLANITGSVGSGITIVAVPWLLVHRPSGDQIYGWVTNGTTLALFAFMPCYGAWLDRCSRKAMLLAGELFGFFATITMSAWVFFSGHVETWQLIASYFCGILYYALHYPAKYAFLQQIINREHYKSLISLIEIQGQAASMLSGGLAGFFIDHAPLWVILTIDASTYLFSFFVQSTLPYRATHLDDSAHAVPPTSAWKSTVEGWRWLAEYPQLSFFFGCTLVPFVVVMVGNYLFPIYVADVLQAPASVFGNGEVVFAAGALTAGAVVLPLIDARGADHLVVYTMALCLIAVGLLATNVQVSVCYLATLLFGFGNAGSRVARNTLILKIIPNRIMGRVGIFFGFADRLLRTALTSACTVIVARTNATLGYGLLWFVLAAAFVGMFLTRKSVRYHQGEAP